MQTDASVDANGFPTPIPIEIARRASQRPRDDEGLRRDEVERKMRIANQIAEINELINQAMQERITHVLLCGCVDQHVVDAFLIAGYDVKVKQANSTPPRDSYQLCIRISW